MVEWRKAWADVTNRYLEQYGHDAHIDHRSHAERGLDEQPTVHEGVIARALEQKGIVSDRCDIVNIGLHFFHKDVRLMLPLVVKHSIVAA